MAEIEASTKLVDILRWYPRAAEYLLELGICECEISSIKDINTTIGDEARKRNLEISKLLEELNQRV